MTRVRVEHDEGIARIVLARPEQKNALDREMVDALHDAIADAGERAEVRVIVVTADGADFCAGADLKALAAMLDAAPQAHYDDAAALGRVFSLMRAVPKPVVAVVRGRALAGGAGIATACDIVLAHEGAEFGYPEVRVGFVPAMVMTMLRRAVGEKRAYDLVASGRRIGAAEAERIGLVSRVIAADGFDDAVSTILGELAAAPASAERLTKRLFYALDGLSFDQGIDAGARTNVEARATDDFRTGVLRFAKR